MLVRRTALLSIVDFANRAYAECELWLLSLLLIRRVDFGQPVLSCRGAVNAVIAPFVCSSLTKHDEHGCRAGQQKAAELKGFVMRYRKLR